MGKINVSADLLAKLKHLSDSGDITASVVQAITNNERVLTLSAGPVTSHVITVTGQLSDLDGTPIKVATDILVTSIPVSGAGTMVIHSSTGTAVVGSGTKSLWLATNATGGFAIDVTNATAEVNLLTFQLDNGQVETLKLTFT
jgi:hypothetical protein